MSDENKTQKEPYQSQMGLWIVIGAALGVVFAQFVDNYGYGIGIGVAFGIVVGAIIDAQNKAKAEQGQEENSSESGAEIQD